MFFVNICHSFSKVIRKAGSRKKSTHAALQVNRFFDPKKHFWSDYFALPGKFSFEKYIFLTDNVPNQFVSTLRGSFLIYMVSLKMATESEDNEVPNKPLQESEEKKEEPQTAPQPNPSQSSTQNRSVSSQSDISMKSKKSSNILHKLIVKTRSYGRKLSEGKILNEGEKNNEEILKTSKSHMLHSPSKEIAIVSRITSLDNTQLNKPKNAAAKVCSKSEESGSVAHSLGNKKSKMSTRSSFFKKLIHKAKYSCESKSKSGLDIDSENTAKSPQDEEICLNHVDMTQANTSEKSKFSGMKSKIETAASGASRIFSYVSAAIPIRYINCNSPYLDITLADGLHQIMEISSRLRDSETHIIQILTRYIQNDGFQKDLLEAVYQHSKLQLETERRVQSLANEMWLQQADISRQQEKVMQESLNAIVRQNRQLQEENETLLRNSEKLIATKGSGIGYLHSRTGNTHLIEDLTKSNEKLQKKVSSMYKQTEELENELINLQKRNSALEERVRSLNSQVQNYKALLQRSNADHELEVANLNQQLHSRDIMINDTIEAGDVLLEDLDALKRLSKSMSCTINWSKFKCRGKSLTDLIHVGRSCINELCREVISMQNLVTLKDKDNEGLRDQNIRLQESLRKASTELDKAVTDLEVYRKREMETNDFHLKYKELETEVKNYKLELEIKKQMCDEKESALSNRTSEVETLQKELETKDSELSEAKKVMVNYENDLSTLRKQMTVLNEALQNTGSGDMTRELTEAQNRVTQVQKDYYQLLNEKNELVEQLTCVTAEREVLNQYQQTYYQYLQTQQKHMESISKENIHMKEQLEYQRSTIQALQTERMRHLDEKNVLRAIYQQFKLEINKSEKMKSTLANMDKETHWLSVVAEYNKQLGEKLMNEMQEKDKTISKLQKSVEMLNTAHTENTKDKIALCVELNEVAAVKDQLSNTLTTEVQKETEAAVKLKTLEEMQRIERLALKELLSDYKNVVMQRDQALASNKQSLEQVTTLQEQLNTLTKRNEDYQTDTKKKDTKIRELSKYVQELKKIADDMQLIMKKDALEYEKNVNHLLNTNDKLLKEKENLEESVKYLQNNTQKLHADLNESRKNEMETKVLLAKETDDRCRYEQQVKELKENLRGVEQQNTQLGVEIENLRALCEKLLNDYELYTQAASEKTVNMLEDVSISRNTIADYSKEIEHLERLVEDKDIEIKQLRSECESLKRRSDNMMDTTMRENDEQTKLINDNKIKQQQLENTISKLETSLAEKEKEVIHLKEELLVVRNDLNNMKTQKDEEVSLYKLQINDMKSEYNNQKQSILDELQKVNDRFISLNQTLEHEKSAQTGIMSAHRELSDKLFKAIKMLIEEKLNCQKQETKSQDLVQQISKLKLEKASVLEQIETLKNELQETKKTNQELTAEKQSILNLLTETQNMNKKAQNKYEMLEEQLNDVMENKRSIGPTKIKISSTPSRDIELETETWEFDQHNYEERLMLLKSELTQSHNTIITLQDEICVLQQQVTVLEFQKCELSLRLHESQSTLETERSLLDELRQVQQRILATLTKLKDDNSISDAIYETLFYLVGKQDVKDLKEAPEDAAELGDFFD